MTEPKVIRRRMADENHAVLTVSGGRKTYRREPCQECPWRTDAPIGAFPAEAYRISANTAEDLGTHTFACHMSGSDKPSICAGFLLRGADHNMAARMAIMRGDVSPAQITSDVPLYDSYRDMAEANGVAQDDQALTRCRGGRD